MDKRLLLAIASMGIVASGSFAADQFDLLAPSTGGSLFDWSADEELSADVGGDEELLPDYGVSDLGSGLSDEEGEESEEAPEASDTRIILARDEIKVFAALIDEAKAEKKLAKCSTLPKKFNAQFSKADTLIKSSAAQAVLGASRGGVVLPVGDQLENLRKEVAGMRETFMSAEHALDEISDACEDMAQAKEEGQALQKYLKSKKGDGFLADMKAQQKSGGIYKKVTAQEISQVLTSELSAAQEKLPGLGKKFAKDPSKFEKEIADATNRVKALHQVAGIFSGGLNDTAEIISSEIEKMDRTISRVGDLIDPSEAARLEKNVQKIKDKSGGLEKVLSAKKLSAKDLIKKMTEVFALKIQIEEELEDAHDDADISEPTDEELADEVPVEEGEFSDAYVEEPLEE